MLSRHETFYVPALDCPEELALIRKGLGSLDGLHAIVPNYVARSLRVEFDPNRLDRAVIQRRLNKIGFAPQANGDAGTIGLTDRPSLSWPVVLGGVLLAGAAAAFFSAGAQSWWTRGLATAAALSASIPVGRAALRAARLRALDMNVLMLVAAAGALATGYESEAAVAMTLFGISLWLEQFSIGRARRAVRSLAELTPTVVHRIVEQILAAGTSTQVEDVDPDALSAGDRLIVRPGERLAVDGVVVEGRSAVNQAPITGESLPVEKEPGDDVFAGSLNGEGPLTIRASGPARESTLAHIARLVEAASAGHSPSQRFIDAFARRYTPAVIALAILIAVVPPLAAAAGAGWPSDGDPRTWFHRGLVMLVIACPCALVISTPVTIVCALHRAARRGILIKGGQYLEEAGRIDAVLLDKTGTLTTGMLEVSRICPAPGHGDDEVLAVAAALEHTSEHPIAAAIVSAAAGRGVPIAAATNIETLRGFGIRGEIDGRRALVGNAEAMRREGIAVDDAAKNLLLQNPAASAVLVSREMALVGVILLADRPRDDAKEAVAGLRMLGVQSIGMVTGDRAEAAEHIASQLGIDVVYADLRPEEKIARVQALALERPMLAMVGDGVNDAPALAAARIGIALGSGASDTALETADIVVLSPKLMRLVELIRLGRRTHHVLMQNVTLALAIKAATLLAAAAGAATMWMAVAADVGASLLVIGNGMRLMRGRSHDAALAVQEGRRRSTQV